MGQIADTRKLYKEKIDEIAKTEENWLSFLDSCSWHFKYNFVDKVLIYAQRPDATACAEMEKDWNRKCHRWVNKDAKGIFVLAKDDDNPYPFRLVFDVSDTHNSKGTEYKLWSVKPEYKEKIIETLETTFGGENTNNELAENIITNAYNMVTDNIQDYLSSIYDNKNGTLLENISDDEIKNITTLVTWASVSYMMMKRCGINAREHIDIQQFSLIKDFNNDKIITALGTAISDIAEMGIREIAKTVINLQKQEKNLNYTFVKNNEQEYSKNKEEIKGGIEYGENRIQPNGELSNTQFSNGERADTKGQIRENEIELSKESQESRILDIINGQQTERGINSNTRENNENDKSNSGENEERTEDNRRNESSRPNALGGNDEQHSTDSRGTSSERTNLQLEEQSLTEILKTEDEQKQIIAEAENASVFSFSQEEIDNVLKIGSGFQDGKFRITEFLSHGYSSNENANFLKNEYGIGGTSANEDGIAKWYDAKGLTLSRENQTLKLTWNDVAKRINELISSNRYLSEKQQTEYIEWLDSNGIIPENQEEINLKSEDYEFAKKLHDYMMEYDLVAYHNNFPLDNTIEQNVELLMADINDELNIRDYIDFLKASYEDLDYDDETSITARNLIVELEKRLPYYEFHNGDIVYIGTEEYIIRSIDDNRVVIADTSFPLFTKELERNVFDERVKDNSANDKLRTGKRIEDKKEQEKQDKEVIEKDKKQEIVEPEIQENKLLKPQTIKKKRNKIEYFDLHPEIPLDERNNYIINNDELGVGGLKEKYERNIEAIKILKICEEQDRYATPEEQESLAKYVGWGGLADVFDSRKDNWHKEYEELKNLLTEDEYREARASTTTAFYTPPIVIKSIYKAIQNMGLQRGNILEPSCRCRKFYGIITRQLKTMQNVWN